MKKKLLSVIILLSFYTIGFAQLSIQDTSGTTITNGDTIIVNGVISTQLTDEFYVFNSGPSNSVQVFCAPTAVRAKACTYSICVGSLCYSAYGDSVNFLCNKFTTPSGKNPNALYTDYNAYNTGTTIIRYDVRNSLATDSAWIFVEFNVSPTGIETIAANNLHVSSFFPNPANSQVSFTYHTNSAAQLTIYNSLGQLTKTMNLNTTAENVSINTTDMPSGIYICKVQTAGESTFRRLIVSH